MKKVPNLSAALTILARAEASEHFMHADVDAFGAPGECHALVARGEKQRQRQARKQAEAIAQRPFRIIRKDAKRRGGFLACSGDPKWQDIVGRIYHNNYPF